MLEEPSAGEFTVDVLVEQSAGDCNRYVYDAQARVLRLADVLHPVEHFPADRGVVPETLGPDGEPLVVVLLVTQPNCPGVHVRARPLALLESSDDAPARILAVPTADPSFSAYWDLGDLTSGERQALDTLFSATLVSWQSASKAVDYVRAARERAAWARVEATKGRHFGRAWQADQLARSGSLSDAHTEAEHELRALPFRFQKYVADCLFPDERILLFITRPPIRAQTSGLSFWRKHLLPDGLLVVTDRQVLWMVDALPPDATMVHWGYVAQVGAVERITRALVDDTESVATITVDFEARGGVESLRVEFPADRRDLLQEATKLLMGFVPSTSTRAVRRLYQPAIDDVSAECTPLETPAQAAAYARLRTAIAAGLGAGEGTTAVAFVPPGQGRPMARFVAVTDRRVMLIEDRHRAIPASYPIAELTSVTLRSSLVGCAFELACPKDGTVDRVRLTFDYPQSDDFVAVFSAVRRVLGQPFEQQARPPVQLK